jgi:hypothetical protein
MHAGMCIAGMCISVVCICACTTGSRPASVGAVAAANEGAVRAHSSALHVCVCHRIKGRRRVIIGHPGVVVGERAVGSHLKLKAILPARRLPTHVGACNSTK